LAKEKRVKADEDRVVEILSSFHNDKRWICGTLPEILKADKTLTRGRVSTALASLGGKDIVKTETHGAPLYYLVNRIKIQKKR
jgi:hypothetical protein